MKKLPLILVVILITFLSACSSTSKVAVEKKPLTSDHQLMLSLLNRPITQDQQMMLAFAKQSDNFQNPYFVNAVLIKGEKSSDENSKTNNNRVKHSFSQLIAQDFNSVRISGPK